MYSTNPKSNAPTASLGHQLASYTQMSLTTALTDTSWSFVPFCLRHRPQWPGRPVLMLASRSSSFNLSINQSIYLTTNYSLPRCSHLIVKFLFTTIHTYGITHSHERPNWLALRFNIPSRPLPALSSYPSSHRISKPSFS
jgi:hypothetical protein